MRRFLLAASIALTALPVVAGAAVSQAAPNPHWVSGEILVKYSGPKANTARDFARRLLGKEAPSSVPGLLKLKINPSADPSRITGVLNSLEGVEYAEPNRWWTTASPNDPSFGSQWGLLRIKAPTAWAKSTGAGIRIAIVDTGVDVTHPDLAGNIVGGRNFTTSDANDYVDRHGHGSHCAGIAAAVTNNGVGIAGTAPGAKILAVKALSDTGSGSTEWIANGIRWSADNGAHVISMSLGLQGTSLILEDAVQYAWNKGSLLVGAAGNNNSSTIFYPAGSSFVIAVGATDGDNNKASFSNFGSWVGVAAPGTSIYSTYKSGGYTTMQGTSMACPFVAGQAALVWSKLGSAATNVKVRDAIEKTATPLAGGWVSFGLVDADAAVDYVDSAPEPLPDPEPDPEPAPNPTYTTHVPNQMKVLVGKAFSPSITQVVDSDNVFLKVEALSPKRSYAGALSADVQFQATVRKPPAGAQLEFDIEAFTDQAVRLTFLVYNWQTKKFEAVTAWPSAISDDHVTTVVLSSPAKYVDANGNVRFRVQTSAPSLNFRHFLHIDLAGAAVRG
ncbi:MAG: S8 family peptidase [Fimbriimonadaceae bacterium]